jgi:flagellar basal-body rod protein FlgB
MAISFDKQFGIHEAGLTVQSKRLGVLANNLANADTPGYKARDIDFRAAMQQAVSAQPSPGHGLKQTREQHLSSQARYLPTESGYRVPTQPDTGDGNAVDAAVEMANYAQAAQQYQTSLTFLNGKIRSLLSVIRGE